MENSSILDQNILSINNDIDAFYTNELLLEKYNKNAESYSRLLVMSWIFFTLFTLILVGGVLVLLNLDLGFRGNIDVFLALVMLISTPFLGFLIWYNVQVSNYVKVIKGFIISPSEDTFNILMNRRSRLILIQVIVSIIYLVMMVLGAIIN